MHAPRSGDILRGVGAGYDQPPAPRHGLMIVRPGPALREVGIDIRPRSRGARIGGAPNLIVGGAADDKERAVVRDQFGSHARAEGRGITLPVRAAIGGKIDIGVARGIAADDEDGAVQHRGAMPGQSLRQVAAFLPYRGVCRMRSHARHRAGGFHIGDVQRPHAARPAHRPHGCAPADDNHFRRDARERAHRRQRQRQRGNARRFNDQLINLRAALAAARGDVYAHGLVVARIRQSRLACKAAQHARRQCAC